MNILLLIKEISQSNVETQSENAEACLCLFTISLLTLIFPPLSKSTTSTFPSAFIHFVGYVLDQQPTSTMDPKCSKICNMQSVVVTQLFIGELISPSFPVDCCVVWLNQEKLHKKVSIL